MPTPQCKTVDIKLNTQSFIQYLLPLEEILLVPVFYSRGLPSSKMTFKDQLNQLNALFFYHLQEHESARDLVQCMKKNDFAKNNIASDDGICLSTFCEDINAGGLELLQCVFEQLCKKARKVLPAQYSDLGDLVSIDGSLINAVLTMYWAGYRTGSKKAKGHFGFDVNRQIPLKVYLTDGNGAERPFVSSILIEGQTGIMDLDYQCHKNFDFLQAENKHFVCRIKIETTRTIIKQNRVPEDNHIFYDAKVLLGTPGVNQSKTSVRVVGYKIANSTFYVATDRHDLTAEEVAKIYKLRWEIESFFKWWEKHLKVYHLIARSEYGVMVQILGGLISYLLMRRYCHDNFNEKISIRRIRQLRNDIQHELQYPYCTKTLNNQILKNPKKKS